MPSVDAFEQTLVKVNLREGYSPYMPSDYAAQNAQSERSDKGAQF